MIYEEFKTDNESLNNYIEHLESQIASFGANNSKKLMRSIDLMAGDISDQLEAKRKEDPNGPKVEVSGKLIDSYIKLCEKAGKIQDFIKISEEIFGEKIPVAKKEQEVSTDEETILKENFDLIPAGNFLEASLKKVQQGK